MSAASIPPRLVETERFILTTHRHESWNAALVSQLRAVGDILWNALNGARRCRHCLRPRTWVRASEERFRLAMNNIAAGVYLDRQGRVTYVNRPGSYVGLTQWPNYLVRSTT